MLQQRHLTQQFAPPTGQYAAAAMTNTSIMHSSTNRPTTVLLLAGSVDNTRAALHFATAAGRVVMRPQLNKLASNKAVIKAMAAEISQLKSRLVSSHGEPACGHSI